MRFGTRLIRDEAGRLVRIVRREHELDTVQASLRWDGDRLDHLLVSGGLRVDGAVVRDPLLGEAHALFAMRAPTPPALTVMSALDWRHPRSIPAIADPAKLPPGTGGILMNVIAHLAEQPLRYAGPYPTPALYRTLLRSFTTTATEDEFCANVLDRATRVARDEIAIDFQPAPHERVAFAHGHVELRDRLERAVIDGIAYEPRVRRGDGRTEIRHETGVARLVDGHAEIWFGDAAYARVASFGEDGTLLDGPHPIPVCTSGAIGKAFPPALCGALAELVAEAVPAPLAADVAALVAAMPMRWADLGGRAARFTNTGFEVHAALWDRIAPHGLGRLALALAEALAPIAMTTVLARIGSAMGR